MRLKKGERTYKLPHEITKIQRVSIAAYGSVWHLQPVNVYAPPLPEFRDGVPSGFGVFHDDCHATHIVLSTAPSKSWKASIVATKTVIL